ncbi:uncharacterized protein LOC122263286 [Penaeus japonicus]|uniref:uncharacterized protein LOC122263286 n=1 Tax=Penaeus japonicus TaxID=27405 RepID=UPI001C713662|nr:uncharacterized protein LOC122263286 [Penaeus japonicus]
MRGIHLFASAVLLSWLVAAEALDLVTGTLGGLAALKGAALIGKVLLSPKKKLLRIGRSVDSAAQLRDGEDLLLSAVTQLDSDGCIPRLLCLLETKEPSTHTQEETLLLEIFANNTEAVTAHNAAFVYATDLGAKTRDSAACKKLFPRCPLNEGELNALLQQAWGCGVVPAVGLEDYEESSQI